MTTPRDLLDEWQRDETGLSPRQMQHYRNDFREAIGLEIPRRRSEIEALLDERGDEIEADLEQAAEPASDDEDEDEDEDGSEAEDGETEE